MKLMKLLKKIFRKLHQVFAMPSAAPCGYWLCELRRTCVRRAPDPSKPCCLRGEVLSLQRAMGEKSFQLEYMEKRCLVQSNAIKQLESDHAALKMEHEQLMQKHHATLEALSDLMKQYKAEVQRNAQLAVYVDKLLATHSSFESVPPEECL